MLNEEIQRLYKAFRLQSYHELFGRIRERDGSLSATEAFAADVVYLLGNPTLSQFAGALGVSQPNATYKAGNLAAKGYVTKSLSRDDKRECRLSVTERFFGYFDTDCGFLSRAAERLEEEYSPQELETFSKMLRTLRTNMEEGAGAPPSGREEKQE